jgi:serine/threonine protein kinase
MPLAPAARFGPYEIVCPLGTGGMGEVYRARDSRLNRDVAIKVLSDAFADDRDRLARFEREAQVLAALNHARIATLHGVEEASGIRALAMELVEGPTLAERLTQGANGVATWSEIVQNGSGGVQKRCKSTFSEPFLNLSFSVRRRTSPSHTRGGRFRTGRRDRNAGRTPARRRPSSH